MNSHLDQTRNDSPGIERSGFDSASEAPQTCIGAATVSSRALPRTSILLGALVASAAGVATPTPTPENPARLTLPRVRQVADVLPAQGFNWLHYNLGLVPHQRVGGVVVFRAWDGIHGSELWRTDGTPEGSWILKDICPGDCSSTPWEFSLPIRGYVYFEAADGDHGRAIWRTDGTAEGTELAWDLPVGGRSADRDFTAFFPRELGDSVFFVGDDGINGAELWRSDGEPGGALEMVADIRPGPEGSQPASLFVVEDTLYFTADDGVVGRELWRTDGTAGGTRMVKDVCEGLQGCFWTEQVDPPAGSWIFAAMGDELLFVTQGHPAYPDALWITDGTDAGTRRIPGIETRNTLFPFRAGDDAVLLAASNGDLDVELWRTDGTTAGTYEVIDLNTEGSGSTPRVLAASPEWVYFSAYESIHGRELWRTDGTAAGTEMVRDLRPGSDSGIDFNFFPLIAERESELVFFPADDGVAGSEPWRSDGTTAGTFLLADINPGPEGSLFPDRLPILATTLHNQMVFTPLGPDNRFRLWISDGVPSGTVELSRLNTQASSMERGVLGFAFSEPQIAAAGDSILFSASDETRGVELWSSDGSGRRARLVKDTYEGDAEGEFAGGPKWLTTSGDSVFFSAYSDDGHRIWVSDGTGEGTRLIDPTLSLSYPDELTDWAGVAGSPRLLFTNGALYLTDGTPAGTYPLTSDTGFSAYPTPAGPHVFFSHGFPDRELWVSLGQPGDARRVADINPGVSASVPERLTALGRRVVFSADDGIHGREMWVSDGTEIGTTLLRDIWPGPASSVREDPRGGVTLAAGAIVCFPADDKVHGEELWCTDGTTEGTFLVADANPGTSGSEPRPWLATGSVVYFSAWDPDHGRELWRMDSLGRGARMVADLRPGRESGISDLIVEERAVLEIPRRRPVEWNGLVYFAGTNGDSGLELWSTDGTAAGTRLVADIHPGSGSSGPNTFTPLGDRLFFGATDGTRGFELWVLEKVPDGELIFQDGFESGDTSRWSVSFPPPWRVSD